MDGHGQGGHCGVGFGCIGCLQANDDHWKGGGREEGKVPANPDGIGIITTQKQEMAN